MRQRLREEWRQAKAEHLAARQKQDAIARRRAAAAFARRTGLPAEAREALARLDAIEEQRRIKIGREIEALRKQMPVAQLKHALRAFGLKAVERDFLGRQK
jgi:hypothetical protein